MTQSFRIERCYLQQDDGLVTEVNFVPTPAPPGTFVTILVGANGTNKSRLLEAIVHYLLIAKNRTVEEKTVKFDRASSSSFRCVGLGLSNGREIVNTTSNQIDLFDSPAGFVAEDLPNRILAVSNLVRDRFPYATRRSSPREVYYYYLGSRQNTNLTTTGALDRGISEAVLSLWSNKDRRRHFVQWIQHFYPYIGTHIAFPRFTVRELKAIRDSGDLFDYFRKRIVKRNSTRRSQIEESEIGRLAGTLTDAFDTIAPLLQEIPLSNSDHPTLALNLSDLDQRVVSRLTNLPRWIDAASYASYSLSPTVVFETRGLFSFDQLSSGEQNILSVGAKIIAYSAPGSLIVIDEPEISLNVSWQQQYVQLIMQALQISPGSHILIATHSPHLIASLQQGHGSIVLARRQNGSVAFDSRDANYEAWGAEAVMYDVLDIPSASNFGFNRELTAILAHIQEGGKDRDLISSFLQKCSRLRFSPTEPLGEIVKEIEQYLRELS